MTDDPFVTHRSLLFTVAYEMLGSASDAEDVVQETWLRWVGVEQAEVDFPRAYLVRMVTRQALNRLRSASRRREDTPAAVRQIAHRAREHVAARRPRMQVDRAEQLVVVEKFLAAISTGDVQGLMGVLAPDVVAIADGGGVVPAARKPITGADKLAALLARFAEAPGFVATIAWFNGMPGARLDFDGAAAAMSLVVEDGRITHMYAINNPHKLGRLETVAELRR